MENFEFIEQVILSKDCHKPCEPQNFRLNVEGFGGTTSEYTDCVRSAIRSRLTGSRQEGGRTFLEYEADGRSKLKVTVCYETFCTSGAVRQTITVENVGDCAEILTHVSSAELDGIGADGLLPWTAPGRFILHSCDTTWQGESQWRHRPLTEYGLVPATVHLSKKTVRFSSTGSWTTCRYFPMVVLEDTETGRSIYMELEPLNSWSIEINNPSSGYGADGVLGLEANCADIHRDGWQVTLQPGESYTAQPCVYGVTDGGFEEAVAELIAYKRETNLAPFKNGVVPLVFNCYMDCIGSNPTTELLLPLIDAAAAQGAEIFCIDAGWFRSFCEPHKNGIGDYNIADDRFPGYGLGGILSLIREKGMIPGIWLEVECCEAICQAAGLSENALCRRNGLPIGGGRNFFDFRDPAVCRHMAALIDRLCDMGIGFIKNDYNRTTGIGFSNYGDAFSVEAAASLQAVLDFFGEVRRHHPDLIIENCCSGAMRADNYFLSHFELQSSSDQELYYRAPSVISGSLACMMPEKCGVWAYPYPYYLPADGPMDMFNNEDLWAKKQARCADGEETIFNMVSGLVGNLYLAGRIDRCDEKNAALVREGTDLFKRDRAFLTRALPVWPAGTFTIEAEGMFCTGLLDREAGRLRLAVWNINAHKKTAVFDLSKWAGRNSSAAIVYPAADTAARCEYHPANGKLSVTLPDVRYSARLIDITL